MTVHFHYHGRFLTIAPENLHIIIAVLDEAAIAALSAHPEELLVARDLRLAEIELYRLRAELRS